MKQPISYKQQIDKLRSRGCEIPNEPECEKILSSINYYRLSAYFLPFKQDDDQYVPGTNLETIFRIYEFDRKIRHLLFHAIEEIEVSLRTQIAYYHAHKYGALGYLDPNIYNQNHDHKKFIENIDREKQVNRKLPFVEHHNSKYAGQFPVWVVIELFTFGMLSYFFADMAIQDQKYIAREIFGVSNNHLRSWIHCCSNLRNMSAHYARLYNHKFAVSPAIPKNDRLSGDSQTRLFGAIFALKKVYPDKDKWDREFIPQLVALVQQYEDAIDLSHIGFESDWEQELRNESSCCDSIELDSVISEE